MGYDYILGVLLDTEKSISSSVVNARKKTKTEESLSDTAHVTILKNIFVDCGTDDPVRVARINADSAE